MSRLSKSQALAVLDSEDSAVDSVVALAVLVAADVEEVVVDGKKYSKSLVDFHTARLYSLQELKNKNEFNFYIKTLFKSLLQFFAL